MKKNKINRKSSKIQQQREKFSRINSSLILFWLLLLFQKMVRSESFGSTAPKTFTSSPGYWLVVDFDGTCTARDTTPLLPVLASFLSDDNDSQRDERLANFKSLEQEYFGLLQQSKSKRLLLAPLIEWPLRLRQYFLGQQ